MPHAIGKITQLQVHAETWNSTPNSGRGLVFIYMDQLPTEKNQRVVIPSDHPAFSEVTQLAISAQSDGAEVNLQYLDSSNTRSTAWDFGVLSVISSV